MNLTDPQVLIRLLRKHGRKAEKGLGQHFLVSQDVVDAIVAQAAFAKGVLEIGPGPGVLTTALSESSEVVALDLDAGMLPVLAESSPRARVLQEDALTADLPAILAQLPEPRALVSNLPYYITGPLLERIADARAGFIKAVLMMQLEVGKRILAPVGSSERGALSVALQSSFSIGSVCLVPPDSFLPPPKVDSIVLSLEPKVAPLPTDEMDGWMRFVRQGFAQPRKTIQNNLTGPLGRDRATSVLEELDIDPRTRPAAITEEQWIALFHKS